MGMEHRERENMGIGNGSAGQRERAHSGNGERINSYGNGNDILCNQNVGMFASVG